MRSEKVGLMAMLLGMGIGMAAVPAAPRTAEDDEPDEDGGFPTHSAARDRARYEERIAEYERQREERERQNAERRARQRELDEERLTAAEEKRKRKAERRAKAAAAQLRGKRDAV